MKDDIVIIVISSGSDNTERLLKSSPFCVGDCLVHNILNLCKGCRPIQLLNC